MTRLDRSAPLLLMHIWTAFVDLLSASIREFGILHILWDVLTGVALRYCFVDDD